MHRLRLQDELIRTLSLSPAARSGDIATYARELTTQVAQRLGISRVSVWLSEQKGKRLDLLDLYDLEMDQHSQGLHLQLDPVPPFWESLRSRRYLDISDLATDPDLVSWAQGEGALAGSGALLICTILTDTNPRGVLCLEQRSGPRVWDANEIQFGCQLAAQVGIVLLNREREALLADLQRHRSLLERAQSVAKMGYWHFDSSTNRLTWSDETYRIFGISPDTPITPERFEPCVLPEDVQLVDRAWDQALSGAPYQVIHRIATPWVEEGAEVICDAEGQPIEVLGTVQDVTERLELEHQLADYREHLEELVALRTAEFAAAKAEAESANRAKSAFLATMSHEIRTPLNAILSYTHLSGQESLSPQQADWLARLNNATRHLLQVVNDLLDFSKIESGFLKIDPHDFVSEQLGRQIVDLVAPQAQAKGLELRVDLGGLPLHLHGDSVRISQVLLNLLNLLSNAVKFTERGWVELTAQTLNRPGTASDTLWIRWTVRDSGIGMTAAQLKRIFKPFEQAEIGTTRKYGGTGLGPTISKHLIERMGGRIGVESQPGAGSTFWFEIPLGIGSALGPNPQLASPANSMDPIPLPQFAARILVAEAHPLNQEAICALLESAGAQVKAVANGQEAIEALVREPFDLVLMDIQMPVLDGLAATRIIRSHPQYQNQSLPILGMTDNPLASDRQGCLEAGMNDFLTKPIAPNQLAQVIARWLPAKTARPNAGNRSVRLDRAQRTEPRPPAVYDPDPRAAQLQDERRFHRDSQCLADILPAAQVQLAEALARGDRERLVDCARRLEEAAACLGACAVQEQARALEQAARRGCPGADLQVLAEDLNAALTTLVGQLGLRGSLGETTSPTARPDSLVSRLEKLANLLAQDDTRANRLFAEHRTAIYHAFGKAAWRLERALQAFADEDALSILALGPLILPRTLNPAQISA